MMNIKQALAYGQQELAASSESARIDAEILLTHVLSTTRAFLYAHATDALDDASWHTFQTLIAQRQQGQPIAYLTGTREFWSMPLQVNRATLIPRPETELLVECTLSLLKNQPHARVLDLGTGSGAVALALAKTQPTWSVTACDISEEALLVAQHNAQKLHMHQVTFITSNWFDAIPPQRFDAIVSNPPYIAEHDPHLTQGDLRFEPPHALSSGKDGLDALRHIIQHAPMYLNTNGILVLEHGHDQASAVSACLRQARYHTIDSWQDVQGHLRVTQGYAPSSDKHTPVLKA